MRRWWRALQWTIDMTERFVDANPYPWPYNGALRPDNTALIVIDMQTDFCGKGGYVDVMGYDLSLTQAPIEPIRGLLEVMRAQGFHVIHTREGHRPDLADLPANKRWRSRQIGSGGVGIGWGYHLFNTVPYVLTLVILVFTCRPGSTAVGSPGELSSTRN